MPVDGPLPGIPGIPAIRILLDLPTRDRCQKGFSQSREGETPAEPSEMSQIGTTGLRLRLDSRDGNAQDGHVSGASFASADDGAFAREETNDREFAARVFPDFAGSLERFLGEERR